jgi:site-specific DNA recombinase
MPGQEPWGIYCRISRVRRKDGKIDTLGVERQEPPCRVLVERLGGKVVEVYIDNDVSAWSGKPREHYARMLKDLTTGRIKGVAAWQHDRFVRRMADALPLLATVEQVGAKLATVAGEVDLSTAAGRYMFRNMANGAEFESDLKSERLLATYDQLAETGKPKSTGKRPFGWRRDGEVVEGEAELLLEAANRILKSETIGAIVRDWKIRGVQTTTGGSFTVAVLRRTLQNPKLYGARVHRGEVVNVKGQAIMDRGVWEDLQRIFNDPVRKQGGGQERHLLSGILVCGYPDCGNRLYYRQKPGRGTYDCPSPSQGGCGRISIDAGRVEEWLEAAVLKASDSPKFAAVLEGETDQTRRAELGAVLTELETAQRDAYDDYRVLKVINRAQYLSANAKLEADLKAVRRELGQLDRASMVLELPEGTSTLREAWAHPDADVAWKRRAVRLALESVTVLPKAPGSRPRFTADRLDPAWQV